MSSKTKPAGKDKVIIVKFFLKHEHVILLESIFDVIFKQSIESILDNGMETKKKVDLIFADALIHEQVIIGLESGIKEDGKTLVTLNQDLVRVLYEAFKVVPFSADPTLADAQKELLPILLDAATAPPTVLYTTDKNGELVASKLEEKQTKKKKTTKKTPEKSNDEEPTEMINYFGETGKA